MSPVVCAPPVSRVILRDTVTRADSTTLPGTAETGQAWEALAGVWGVRTNRLYVNDTAGANRVLAAQLNREDVDVGWDVWSDHWGLRYGGPLGRIIDASNWLFAEVYTTTLTLYKLDGGSFTNLTSMALSHVAGTTYRYRMRCLGNVITVYRDGVQQLQHTLAGANATKFGAGSGATKFGASYVQQVTNAGYIDNALFRAV